MCVGNAEGWVLTKALMEWFWDHYADPDDRSDPRASPIDGDLAGLPPTVVFTAQFDPLRDGGIAYVDALNAAGTKARHSFMRGHMHTSISSVDVIISSAPERAEVAAALTSLLGSAAPVSAG